MSKELMERIAGDIVLSPQPGKTLKKWRECFNISQHQLAHTLGISPSVISDYESGRRKSPGVKVLRRIVEALIEIDKERGGKFISFYSTGTSEAIIALDEFSQGIHASVFMNIIEGENHTTGISPIRTIYGYTVVDSVKAIMSFSPQDYLRIYGRSSERALMFAGVKFGRSPMIAVRMQAIKPAMVVYVHPDQVDPLAVKLAEIDNVLLVVTDLQVNALLSRLKAARKEM